MAEVWMPGCFIDQRERSKEELKSKGRTEKKRQLGSKVKGSSILQTSPKEWQALGGLCGWGVLISSIHRWAGTDYLSMSWRKTLYFIVKQRSRVLWGKLLSIIIITKARQREIFQHGVRTGSVSAAVSTEHPVYAHCLQHRSAETHGTECFLYQSHLYCMK